MIKIQPSNKMFICFRLKKCFIKIKKIYIFGGFHTQKYQSNNNVHTLLHTQRALILCNNVK